jgi:hypothetical protein
MKRRSIPAVLLGLYATLHLSMLAYDLTHPDVWLKADRAEERIRLFGQFSDLNGSGAKLAFIGTHGVTGDYLVQKTLYDAGGLASLLIGQVALCLLSVLCVYRLACTFFGEGRLSLIVAAAYALLPQTLIFPHQLSAEAWFVPCVVFGFYFMSRWFVRGAPGCASRSGLFFAFATLTRPTVIPFAALSGLIYRRGSNLMSRGSYYIALLIPIAAWLIMVHAYSGRWTFADKTSASVGNNLLVKALLISDNFPPDANDEAEQRYIDPARARGLLMTVGEYARFCADYPVPCMKQVGQDALNFFLKSGIERVTLDYLGLIPEHERIETQTARRGSPLGWAQVVRRRGVLAAIESYLARYPAVVGISLAAACAFGLLTLFYLAGAVDSVVALMKRRTDDRAVVLALLAVFPPYLFAASSVVSSMQSRHRAAAEFAMLIVAGNGWRVWKRWIAGKSRVRLTGADGRNRTTQAESLESI